MCVTADEHRYTRIRANMLFWPDMGYINISGQPLAHSAQRNLHRESFILGLTFSLSPLKVFICCLAVRFIDVSPKHGRELFRNIGHNRAVLLYM